ESAQSSGAANTHQHSIFKSAGKHSPLLIHTDILMPQAHNKTNATHRTDQWSPMSLCVCVCVCVCVCTTKALQTHPDSPAPPNIVIPPTPSSSRQSLF